MKKSTMLMFLFLKFLCSTETLHAQITPNVILAKQYGGTNTNYPSDMVTDKDGNIYITGGFWYETKFEDIILTAQGIGAGFVAKINSSGVLLWVNAFGGSGLDAGRGITVDNSGNVYTTGVFTGEATFGSITLNAGNVADIFVVKQDGYGNVLWATQFSDIQDSSIVIPQSIAVDTQGNIYTVGHFANTVTFEDITLTRGEEATNNAFIVKQNESGNVLWAKKFGETGNISFDKIITDVSDNIYITGGWLGEVNFGNTILTTPYQKNHTFLVKMDNLGEPLWTKHFGGNLLNDSSKGEDITLDEIGNIYVTESFVGTLLVENTTLISDFESLFIIKMDNLGEPLWTKGFESGGNAIGLGVATDTLNNVYVVGRFNDSISFDSYLLLSAGDREAFVLKMNSLGAVEWAERFGGIFADLAVGVDVDTEGDILVLGRFSGTVTFGTTTFSSLGSNSSDIFLLKLSPEGLGISKNQLRNYWNVYPNPTNKFINLYFPDDIENISSVEIFNMFGRRVKVFENLSNFKNLDLSEFTSGIYLLNIINYNGTTQTIKIKKQ